MTEEKTLAQIHAEIERELELGSLVPVPPVTVTERPGPGAEVDLQKIAKSLPRDDRGELFDPELVLSKEHGQSYYERNRDVATKFFARVEEQQRALRLASLQASSLAQQAERAAQDEAEELEEKAEKAAREAAEAKESRRRSRRLPASRW